ncbi:MAG: ATP phosphoribosyltransferase [Chloroflexota bacterium]
MKLALPKGRLMSETISLLERSGLGFPDYAEGVRVYHLASDALPDLSAKILHEKDIPIQVAIGNYDLGICGEDWVDELLAKYPTSNVVKVKGLGYGEGALYLASYGGGTYKSPGELSQVVGVLRIASEYPNLAEAVSARLRLRHFMIYPLWGAAEAYPPETADMVLLLKGSEAEVLDLGLLPLMRVTGARAYLIANRVSWESRDMDRVLASLGEIQSPAESVAGGTVKGKMKAFSAWGKLPAATVRVALPDGHQQAHVRRILDAAKVAIIGYENGGYRPRIDLEGVVTKVIRPQDMPVQVANGNFDLAITGRDCLTEHLCQFPGSPVKELLNLKYGRVRLVAAVSQDLPVDDVGGLRLVFGNRALRVASEYVNIADSYARSHRLGQYRVIPSWGATEAFIPEDADLLIENTETGKTLLQNNLKIIDTLFESTACLIGGRGRVANSVKRKRIASIVELLKGAVERSQLAYH